MTLSIHQIAARRRVEKQKRIIMLERRLDKRTVHAEKFKSGRTREKYLALAEETREEQRKLDH